MERQKRTVENNPSLVTFTGVYDAVGIALSDGAKIAVNVNTHGLELDANNHLEGQTMQTSASIYMGARSYSELLVQDGYITRDTKSVLDVVETINGEPSALFYPDTSRPFIFFNTPQIFKGINSSDAGFSSQAAQKIGKTWVHEVTHLIQFADVHGREAKARDDEETMYFVFGGAIFGLAVPHIRKRKVSPGVVTRRDFLKLVGGVTTSVMSSLFFSKLGGLFHYAFFDEGEIDARKAAREEERVKDVSQHFQIQLTNLKPIK